MELCLRIPEYKDKSDALQAWEREIPCTRYLLFCIASFGQLQCQDAQQQHESVKPWAALQIKRVALENDTLTNTSIIRCGQHGAEDCYRVGIFRQVYGSSEGWID